jgi:hypothetical protein
MPHLVHLGLEEVRLVDSMAEAAGGGGWYGGGGSTPDSSGDDDRGGGGGSGFIYTDTNTQPVEGYLVHNHVLTDAMTLDGTNTEIPTYDGLATMTGNIGDGHANISLISTTEDLDEIVALYQEF